jgi:hypothetical protein
MTLRFSAECTRLLPRPGQIEGDAGDPLDLVGVVDLGVDGALLAVAEIGDGLGFAEIHPAGELAHDQDIEVFDQLALERGGLGQRRIADGGAQIGIKGEILAQAQQPGLGPLVIGHVVPLRPADGAEHDRVGGLGARHVGIRDRLPWAS